MNGTIRASFMTNANRPEGRRIRSLGPLKIAKLRGNPNALASRFHWLHSQDGLAEESGRAAGPAVTKAMSETLVTVGAEVTVDVLFAWRHQFVDARSFADPIEVEIFPKGSGA